MQTPSHSPQAETIRAMFSKVASRYDHANQVLSFGVHHLWRNRLVKESKVRPGDSVLDCATGTGDLAIAFKKAVGPSGAVIGTDFCAEMLAPAPAKAERLGLKIQFEQADVTRLPYASESFDVASISFGIRNVENPSKGLSEMARVLKPGGRLMVLEFGQSRLPVFGPLYELYSEHVLPRLGGWVSGQKDAYRYLQASSAAFPCREEFLDMMNSTGQLTDLHYWSLTGGIAFIYSGTKRSLPS